MHCLEKWSDGNLNGLDQWFPTFFVQGPSIYFWRAWGATKSIFYIHLPSYPLFSLPLQQLGGLGSTVSSPAALSQQGLERNPSRQRILEHSMAKSDSFDMLREIFQHSKQHDFYQELVIFTLTGIASHTLPAYSVKMRSFTVFAHIFLKFFRRSRATFWGLAGHFWPAGHRLGTTGLDRSLFVWWSCAPCCHKPSPCMLSCHTVYTLNHMYFSPTKFIPRPTLEPVFNTLISYLPWWILHCFQYIVFSHCCHKKDNLKNWTWKPNTDYT